MTHIGSFLGQLIFFCCFTSPLFGYIFYEFHRHRHFAYFSKRRPLLTLIICISLYAKVCIETLLTPQYTILLTNKQFDLLVKYIYYTCVMCSVNTFVICTFARVWFLLFDLRYSDTLNRLQWWRIVASHGTTISRQSLRSTIIIVIIPVVVLVVIYLQPILAIHFGLKTDGNMAVIMLINIL